MAQFSLAELAHFELALKRNKSEPCKVVAFWSVEEGLLGSIDPSGFVGMPGRSLDVDNNRVVDHPVANLTK